MSKIKLETNKEIVPKIYAYTTPEIKRHDGWTKIGYTERESVEKRIEEQTKTVDVDYNLEWYGTAIFEGSHKNFRDTDFHLYLSMKNYKQEEGKNNEWFNIDGKTSEKEFYAFKADEGNLPTPEGIQYNLRAEQEQAVLQTKLYREGHLNGEYLWNAKPRFGKTLSVYDFAKRIGAKNILIVTNRPAIANSWYEDYVKFLGEKSRYSFVSSTDALKDRTRYKYVRDRKTYEEYYLKENYGCVEFVSLQDLKGSIYFGGKFNKLREVAELDWDLLIVDEAHEGVDTYKTDVAFEHINRQFTLHLSGTPFKALANAKFEDNAIFNWTYADEQDAKEKWNSIEENPYTVLPKLNLFTYQMSEIVREKVKQGVDIRGKQKEFAFDLNEFFSTDTAGNFVYDNEVDTFLDSLVTLEKMPFSTPELREELKHTFWLLYRVDSAKALVRKLQNHSVFKDYEIVLAAGDGKIDEDEGNQKAFNKVREVIENVDGKYKDKSITVSVGQLTTGVTIPEWTGVLMLSNIESPSLYMQAAFRAQNPNLQMEDGKYLRKENAYVFDFDPARTLCIFEEFANNLYPHTAGNKGTTEERKENIRKLLNFFPVLGEDDSGEMVTLDAEKVLTVPRKIRSREVVNRGFMSDFLFANVSNLFHAPIEVINMINEFKPIQQPKSVVEINNETAENLNITEDGEVNITDEQVIGLEKECFGNKVYGVADELKSKVREVQVEHIEDKKKDKEIKAVQDAVKEVVLKPLIEVAQEKYDLKSNEKAKLLKNSIEKTDKAINRVYANHAIDIGKLEIDKDKAIANCLSEQEKEEVVKQYEQQKQVINDNLVKNVEEVQDKIIKEFTEGAVRQIEENRKKREKQDIENMVRDHLRGFSRTIPSFLMAYEQELKEFCKDGDYLNNFDKVVPPEVFLDVTGITIKDFRFLRDGGEYTDDETGELKNYRGQLFDEVVFNDSVKEFFELKNKLSDYFNDNQKEDIFDYIPPQKTNQIYTPKKVVKEMVDMLEQNEPGCFDDDTHTFIDLYMKSGLYITEVVKRLYKSEALKAKYPNSDDRLKHIFEKQVYGLAPTEIIYRIARNFILGFDKNGVINKDNIVLLDATPFVQDGTIEEKLDEIYGENNDIGI